MLGSSRITYRQSHYILFLCSCQKKIQRKINRVSIQSKYNKLSIKNPSLAKGISTNNLLSIDSTISKPIYIKRIESIVIVNGFCQKIWNKIIDL